MDADKESLDQVKRLISRLYHYGANADEVLELMRGQNINANVVKAVYDQLSEDARRLMTDRFNYYTLEVDIRSHFDIVSCWTSRYLLGYSKSTDSPFHDITIFDAFNNKSMQVFVEKSAEQLLDVYPLKDGFGLLKENGRTNSFISLVFLDLSRCSLQKLHTVEYQSDNIEIVVNKADPTTFLLNDLNNEEQSLRMCKIVEKKIVIENVIKINFLLDCFYDRCVYGLKRRNEDRRFLDILQICIYNVENKTETDIDLELPDGFEIDDDEIDWIRGNLFLQLKCENGTNGIGYYNVQARKWNILDFSSRLEICRITGFEKGNLIVNAEEDDVDTYHFYKISFGKPESLENTAWLSLVKNMKKCDTVKDPYEAARKYLPSNSNINCPF